MNEDQLAKQIKQFQELAKQNKNVDVAALAISALHSHQANVLTSKEKRWAYIIALSAPPFGLFYAAKFYFSEKDDGVDAAFMCVILTFLSIILFVLLIKFSGSSNNGITLPKPSDLQNITQ